MAVSGLKKRAKRGETRGVQGTRGILKPLHGLERFELVRRPPPEELAPFVDWLWGVRWDLDESPPYQQEILPAPCCHLSFDAGGFQVHGPGTRRFVRQLTGKAWAAGVRFKPAGLSAFCTVPISELSDRVVAARDVLARVPQSPPYDIEAAFGAFCELLRGLAPVRSEAMALCDRVVELTQRDPGITSVASLARATDVAPRTLHRLLARHVGVGTKWIVRRARVQEAAERVARGEKVAWTAVAAELGYADQAHLIRDFKAQIGCTPAEYARRCAARAQ
jgi:AraC-like DNA-binding protein